MSDACNAQFEVFMGKSQYGCLRPQILIRFSAQARWRVARATALRLAAEIDLATPEHETWNVEVEEPRDDRSPYRVAIETSDGTPAEAARAIAVLHRVVGRP